MAGGLWQSLEVLSWGLYEKKCHLLTSHLCNLSHTCPWTEYLELSARHSALGAWHQVPSALMSWAMA